MLALLFGSTEMSIKIFNFHFFLLLIIINDFDRHQNIFYYSHYLLKSCICHILLIRRAVLIILWAALIAGAVKVSQFEKEYSEYNPYDVLQIDPVSQKLLAPTW